MMQISANKVVSIHYTLKDEEGEVIETSAQSDPLAYIHGAGNIIPGLEGALSGKDVGDKFEVDVPPEEAYGFRKDELIQAVPMNAFQGINEILPGMQFQAQTPSGMQLLTVVEVEQDQVIVDGNHPLAGQTLTFEVEVTDIRDATEEELDHGHVHGPGEYQHD